LRAHGIEVARNRDGSANLYKTLLNVRDAYQAAGKGAEGDAVAAAAFGRSGQALLPVLTATEERLNAINDAAERHHEVFTQADIDKAVEYKIANHELHQSVEGLQIELGQKLVPKQTEVAKGLTGLVEKSEGWGKSLSKITRLNPISRAQSEILRYFSRNAGNAADAADALSGSLDGTTNAFEDADRSAQNTGKALDRLRDQIFGVQDAQQAVNADFQSLMDSQADLVQRRADVEERLADARETGARRVRDAEENLAEARRKLNDVAGSPENAEEYMRRYLTGQSGMTDEIANATKAGSGTPRRT
jgi:chromosome segregation ATPase